MKGYYGKPREHQVVGHKADLKRDFTGFMAVPQCRYTKVGKRTVCVKPNENVYLGRQVKDIPPEGFSNLREIRDTLYEIEEDYLAGVINKRTFRGRLMRLRAIIYRTTKGELGERKNKMKAISMVNRMLVRYGWKPIRYQPKNYPTPAQIRAAKENIKKAQEVWREMHSGSSSKKRSRRTKRSRKK